MVFNNAAGAACAGCSLYTYASGTTTPSPTYTDATGTSQNTNPIILGTDGGKNIWLGTNSYKLILKDTDDSTIWTVDGVNQANAGCYGGNSIANGCTGATTAQGVLFNIGIPQYSFLNYGAVEDNSTDSMPAVVKAYNACPSTGGCTITLPESTGLGYVLNGQFPNTKPNMTIEFGSTTFTVCKLTGNQFPASGSPVFATFQSQAPGTIYEGHNTTIKTCNQIGGTAALTTVSVINAGAAALTSLSNTGEVISGTYSSGAFSPGTHTGTAVTIASASDGALNGTCLNVSWISTTFSCTQPGLLGSHTAATATITGITISGTYASGSITAGTNTGASGLITGATDTNLNVFCTRLWWSGSTFYCTAPSVATGAHSSSVATFNGDAPSMFAFNNAQSGGVAGGKVLGFTMDGNDTNQVISPNDTFYAGINIFAISSVYGGTATVEQGVEIAHNTIQHFGQYGWQTYGDLSGGYDVHDNYIQNNGDPAQSTYSVGQGAEVNQGSSHGKDHANWYINNFGGGYTQISASVVQRGNSVYDDHFINNGSAGYGDGVRLAEGAGWGDRAPYTITSVATGTGVYTGTFIPCPQTFPNCIPVGSWVIISGFTTEVNNGLYQVTGVTTTHLSTNNAASVSQTYAAIANNGGQFGTMVSNSQFEGNQGWGINAVIADSHGVIYAPSFINNHVYNGVTGGITGNATGPIIQPLITQNQVYNANSGISVGAGVASPYLFSNIANGNATYNFIDGGATTPTYVCNQFTSSIEQDCPSNVKMLLTGAAPQVYISTPNGVAAQGRVEQASQAAWTYGMAAGSPQFCIAKVGSGAVCFDTNGDVTAGPIVQAASTSGNNAVLEMNQAGVTDWKLTNTATTGVLALTGGVITAWSVDPATGYLTVPNIPTSAGSGGLYVCIDTTGKIYKKSTCP